MFRWLKELLKRFGLNRNDPADEQNHEEIIQNQTAEESSADNPFEHEINQNQEPEEYDEIIEEAVSETVEPTSEIDLSELIKMVSDTNTSDELNTIDRLVDALGSSDYAFSKQPEVPSVSHAPTAVFDDIKRADIAEHSPVSEESSNQDQKEYASSYSEQQTEACANELSADTEASDKTVDDEDIPEAIPDIISEPVTEADESADTDLQEICSQKESVIDIEDTEYNAGNEILSEESDVIDNETPDHYSDVIQSTQDDTHAEDLPAEIDEPDTPVYAGEASKEIPDVIADSAAETDESANPDLHEEPSGTEPADTVHSVEETSELGGDSEPVDEFSDDGHDTTSVTEEPHHDEELTAIPNQTILINVDELPTDYEELNLDASDFSSLMDSLCYKVRSNKLIGYDLLQIINNEEVISKIHANAEQYLFDNYSRSSANVYTHKEDIIVSLIIIALLKYDGSFWEHVRNQYSKLYYLKSEQKTDRMIRQILAEYITEDTRYINFVIRQAIIPYNYLYDFITFAFDIYKGTLGYEIPEKLDYILANIYIDVSSMYETDSEQLQTSVKTYKLIKTTKDIIDNVQWFGELIAYTNLVLRYIDLNYWKDNKDQLPYSDYFSPVVDKWIENNRSLFYEERDYKTRERSSWSASFSIDQTDIILHIANCIIRKENNPNNIVINVMNDGYTFATIRPKVTEEIGGYLVHGTDIRVRDLLGKLEYQIACGNKIIYSTNDKLHREYILFGENHSEVKNTSQYYGNLDIVTYRKNSSDLDVYYSDPEYDFVIAQKYVEPFDSIRIGSEEIYFYAEEKTSLNADKVNNVRINSRHHTFDLYKSINYLSLITAEPPENLALQINRENYHWKDWLVKQSNNGYLYKINLSEFVNKGFNEINILNWKNDNQVVYSVRLFYDPGFSVSFQPTPDRKIRMNINTNVVSVNSVESDMDADNVFDIAFDHPVFSSTLHMIVTPGIPVYRIDNKPWHLFDEYISAKSITSIYSRIYFDGIEPDSVKLLSKDPERIINDVLIQNIGGKTFITIEKILSVSNTVSIASLAFYKDGIAKDTIDVFYRAVYDRNSLETDYDSETNEGIIRFNVLGNDQIHVTVFSEDQLFYRNDDEHIPAEIRIPNIDSFKKYSISITGGKENLFEMNSSQQYEILSQVISFYNVAGIIKRSFTIHSCRLHYTKKDSDEGRDYMVHPHQSEIEVLRKLSSDKYEVAVKQIMGGNDMSFIAEMEMTSNIMSGDFWCLIKCKEKWLKYNATRSTPTNIINNRNYMDILEYHVYYKSTENLKKKMLDELNPESNENAVVAVLPFQEKYFNKGLADLDKGKPVLISISLSAYAIMPKKQETIKGDILILKVNETYYQCRLAGEKFRIEWQLSNGIPRLKIDAKKVYDFIETETVNGLPINNLKSKYSLLYKGNIPGKKNDIGYIYSIKKSQ